MSTLDMSVINDCLFELPALEHLSILRIRKKAYELTHFMDEQFSLEENPRVQSAVCED